MFEVVPNSEVSKVIEAAKNHCCVTCYKPIAPYDGGFYCYECDPRGITEPDQPRSAGATDATQAHNQQKE